MNLMNYNHDHGLLGVLSVNLVKTELDIQHLSPKVFICSCSFSRYVLIVV